MTGSGRLRLLEPGTLSETPGQVSGPAPRKKAPGTGTMNRKITEQVKLKMKRLVKTDLFLTAKEIKTKIIALKDFTNQHVNRILSKELAACRVLPPQRIPC